MPKAVVIFLTVFITWLPLYFSSDLQIQFPETLMLEEMRIINMRYISKAKKILKFLLYVILILTLSTIAYIILFIVLKTINGSSNLNLFKLIF